MSAYETLQLPGVAEEDPSGAARSPGASRGPADGTLTAPRGLDWAVLRAELDAEGVALTPPLLTDQQCAELRALFDDPTRFRSTVVMSRHRFGEGQYRCFTRPLPEVVQALRQQLYPPLARIANTWAERLGEPGFPAHHDGLVAACAAAGQHRPTPLLLRHGPGGYDCLHQDVYGDLTFPLQVEVMLDRPDEDFTGGESVFVEQRPRARSRPVVKRPQRGQALVFAVSGRPVRSARGHSRVMLRHGVSAVHSGHRHALGVIFHDAR
ncbi:2OG-Fe(II) oxygenase [Streptomyces sp. TG1A-8]|uniref:2OG-Fe(II) oxygenase n=1 Tax=Streptomyces sp. TG1A-8 TaxID=3051385 RepID=UPI00265BEC47|nr:2OG-Fe(II) oxygenase [Streptomyces sp. TG1A-8]MDO0924597.1 2OG-Fe(II) oxygenase [Streptomyces sp. TG1A-8]